MSKAKNRRKILPPQVQGGFNRFLNDMHETLMISGVNPSWQNFNKLPNFVKRKIYDRIIHIKNPKAGNQYITPGELKDITVKIKRYYRERTLKVESGYMSSYQLYLFMLYLLSHAEEIERHAGVKDYEDAVSFRKLANSFTDVFYKRFLADCCRIVTQMSNPAKKHYSIDVRAAALYKEDPSIDLVIEIYGAPVNKSMIVINGNWRPIYQLGKVKFHENTVWVTVPSCLLKEHYKGKKDLLEVYIQSHALNRLKERLDILDEEALNYALWDNTCDIKVFENYKGYLLLPFKLYNIKIGYMVANIMDDKIVFRTFLFITHNCTPEGDKLRSITGLSKQDITYWKIDRLSTFINMNMTRNADLLKLLEEAEMSDILQLKEKTFNIDNMQIANLDGLMEYIKQGRREVFEPV